MASARYGQGPGDFFDSRFENALKFSWVWLTWAIPLLIIIWLASGIFIVDPDEQGVVRRFGRVVRVTEPGPNYHLPRPIERVDKVKVKQVRRIEIGFTTITQGPPARYTFHPEESLMLTGDEQIVDAQIIVQYQVSDPARFLFNVRDLEGTSGAIKDAAEVALRHVVGQRPIDDVLVGEKLQVEVDIRRLLQKIIDGYEAGIRIIETKLQTVQPPQEVAGAFSDVVSAREDKDKLIKQADGYREDVIPKARGRAEEMVRKAEAYKAERTERAHGDAERFLAVLKEYQNARDVTQKRLYLETMEKILPGIRKFVIDAESGGNLLQLLPLDERSTQK
ncbi:MAG TPA: FtsH protease activity modulator HflK [Planctomycetes bacterium]|nr:FtsH protease activity modulator HflK [Planctomycetota bacterium]